MISEIYKKKLSTSTKKGDNICSTKNLKALPQIGPEAWLDDEKNILRDHLIRDQI